MDNLSMHHWQTDSFHECLISDKNSANKADWYPESIFQTIGLKYPNDMKVIKVWL
jgi:hypothetical protein